MSFLEMFQHAFMRRALAAGAWVGLLCSVLGVFVVLRGMAFLTDALAHVSIVGYALGVLTGVQPELGAVLVSAIVGIGILELRERFTLTFDTSIGIFFSAGMAVAVLLVLTLQDRGYRLSLHDLLFGQILGVGPEQLWVLGGFTALMLPCVFLLIRPLLQVSFHAPLARMHGVHVKRIEVLFMLLMAATVAISIQVTGAILVGAMMVVPAATAKTISRSFGGMILMSIVAGLVSSLSGVVICFELNWPAGPTMVLCSVALLAMAWLGARLRGAA